MTSPQDAAAGAWGGGSRNRDRGEIEISNCEIDRVHNHRGEEETRIYAKPIKEIAKQVLLVGNGFPKSHSGMLFVLDRESRPRYLGKQESLFGWIHERAMVKWHPARGAIYGGDPVSKSELFEQLGELVPKCDQVEYMPHEPRMERTYYCPMQLPPSDGSALQEFLDRLNPETEIDRRLLLAAMLTPGWGGPNGTRPAFLITSDHGKGVGKTQTAIAISRIWGGHVLIQAKEKWETARSRLLDDESLHRRCIIIDNVRNKMVSEFLESVLTIDRIDGHRMYKGQFSRPNNLTWFLTANDPDLSSDLAKRSVVIKIGKAQWSHDFVGWKEKFLRERGMELVSDLLAILRSQPKCSIAPPLRDRFWQWQEAILTRIDGGGELAEVIIDRRDEVDSDLMECADVADAISTSLAERGFDPEKHSVGYRREAMYEMLERSGVMPPLSGPKAMARWLHSLMHEEPLKSRLMDDSNIRPRRWVWIPPRPDTAQVRPYWFENGPPRDLPPY